MAIMPDPVLILLAFAIALAVGLFSAILGVGGGTLNVPVFVFLLGFDQATAVGTSLAVIIFTAAAAAVTYARQGMVLYRTAAFLAPTAIVFSVAAAFLSVCLSRTILTALFAGLLFLIACRMWWPSFPLIVPVTAGPRYRETAVDRTGRTEEYSLYSGHMLTWGAVSGCINGFTGVGGGVINVPAITNAGIPIHAAVATSTLVICVASIFSTLAHYAVGHTAPAAILAPYIVGAMIGAVLGAKVARRIPELHLRKGFAVFLVIVGLVMLGRALG
jgi:uncharacterized membrane protein YfcA